MSRISRNTYSELLLFDPPTGRIHVKDLVQLDHLYSHRLSSQILGMLLLGVELGIIQKTQACYFRAPLLPHVQIRKLSYPQGRPFLGPDGGYISVQGFSLRGDRRHGFSRSL